MGEPLDLINAGISLARGNYADAALSVAAMMPFGGQAATGAKMTNKASKAVAKNLDSADEVLVGLKKACDGVLDEATGLPCFPAGTPVLTATGWKPIEKIQAGDVVISRPEQDETADVGPQEVQEAHQREGEVLTLTINGKEIQTTTEHPFWVNGRGWVEAWDLKVGDELSTTDQRWVPIENVFHDGTVKTV